MKSLIFISFFLTAALLSAQDAFRSLLADAEKADWRNFEENMIAAEAVAGADQEKLQEYYRVWITRCAAQKKYQELAEKTFKAAADPRLDKAHKTRVLTIAAKHGKFSMLKERKPQLNDFLTVCETFSADPENDPADREALAVAMAELIFNQARLTEKLLKNDLYRIIKILEESRSDQTMKNVELNILLAAAHISLNNSLPAETALTHAFASRDQKILDRANELQGDLYISKKFYADAFTSFAEISNRSIVVARKMATCAMMDGQYARAAEILESVRDKATGKDLALLEAQIKNLKRRAAE